MNTQILLVFNQRILVILFLFLATNSCRQLVEDEFPDFTPVPTMNSFLVADSVIKVHVSMAGKMDTVPLSVVNQATVKCLIDDSAAIDLTPTGNGYYTGPKNVKAGSVYRFKVIVSGFPEMTATDTVPEFVKLISIEHIKVAGVDEEGQSFPAVKITFPVFPDHIQYFQVILRINSYRTQWRSANLKDFTDPILLAEGLPIAVFNSGKIKGNTYTIQLDYTTGSYSRIDRDGPWIPNLYPLVVEFKTISWQYYQYLKQLYLYETGRYPEFIFGSYQGYPLYSNVINGAGIIAGYSMFRSEIITPIP
jgi:hypothetical protein